MQRCGPSSLGAAKGKPDLKLVEIHREDIASLPECLAHLRASANRFIVFCDDLSFDKDDTSYKSLKAVLEGGIEGRPQNVVFYATSNRRHLMPRDMMENERSTAINPSEAVEEKVSLSDRFGLWLGFHNATQDEYLDMVRSYAAHHKLKVKDDALVRQALEWSITRGARSGRVAWQFIQDLAGGWATGSRAGEAPARDALHRQPRLPSSSNARALGPPALFRHPGAACKRSAQAGPGRDPCS